MSGGEPAPASKDQVEATFRRWDANRDGFITASELREVLVRLGVPKSSVHKVFESADINHDGKLSYKEFIAWVYGAKGAKAVLPPDVFAKAFSQDVGELGRSLVRNVSNIPSGDPHGPPPVPAMWRTCTGKHEFVIPPGAEGGLPQAYVAFQVIQFLAGRTEDSSMVVPAVAKAMTPHRPMFKRILDACGEIVAVHAVKLGEKSARVDLFLRKEDLFRLRIDTVELEGNLCSRMNGFQPCPVVPEDVPEELWRQVEMASVAHGQGQPPMPVERLQRSTSASARRDLEHGDLVLTSEPMVRHRFRVRVRLADGCARMPRYVLLVPRLVARSAGHPRYLDHEVSIQDASGFGQFESEPFEHFVVANVPGRRIQDLVVEHTFTNCKVRLQERGAAPLDLVVPVPRLSAEERAANSCCAFPGREKLQALLKQRGLARGDGERDLAFAARLGQALCEGYRADAAIVDRYIDELPTLIWEKRAGDCSAFNLGFVCALRLFGVPARVSLGFKYGQAVKHAIGSVAATHAAAEFFAEGVGWVPCDATLGLRRLGHEASSDLSFVEWRPAVEATAERAVLERVLAEAAVGARTSAEPGAYRGLGPDGRGEPFWASQAGLKLFEGGPFVGKPLPPSKARECMAVMEDMGKVMAAVGVEGPVDWSQMFPSKGVFLCSYELTELPL